jgi:hypothetical protein
VTARATGRLDEHLVGVPRVGDLVGRGDVEIGEYAVARMGPLEFAQFIASIRGADSADASSRDRSAGRGRRMSDQTRDPTASLASPLG